MILTICCGIPLHSPALCSWAAPGRGRRMRACHLEVRTSISYHKPLDRFFDSLGYGNREFAGVKRLEGASGISLPGFARPFAIRPPSGVRRLPGGGLVLR